MEESAIQLPPFEVVSAEAMTSDSEAPDAARVATAPAGYTLIRRVAQGGMGSIWQAEHTLLGRHVAIKYIKSSLPVSALKERFCVEAQAAARLMHPGVASVFDFGVTDGVPYLVMEWLDGTPLDQRLAQRGKLRPTDVAALGVNLADTLRAAHAADIVHRDVKPGNIVLIPTAAGEQPKVVDFGIAKLSERTERRITEMGQPIGSPEYMSPEQVVGSRDIDARADVWGLCTTLYECLTGASPYAGVADCQLFEAIMRWPVVEPAVFDVDDQGLWEILQRGLRKRPSERWQSMAELGQALSGWLLDHGVHADVAGQSLKRNWTLPPLAESVSADRAVKEAAETLVAEPRSSSAPETDTDSRVAEELESLAADAMARAQTESDGRDSVVLPLVRPVSTKAPAASGIARRTRRARLCVAALTLASIGAFTYAAPLPVKAWPAQAEHDWDMSLPHWVHTAAASVPEQQQVAATLSAWTSPTPENTGVQAGFVASPVEAVVPIHDGGLEEDAHVDAAPAPRKPTRPTKP